MLIWLIIPIKETLNLNLNSLLVKRQIDNPSPGTQIPLPFYLIFQNVAGFCFPIYLTNKTFFLNWPRCPGPRSPSKISIGAEESQAEMGLDRNDHELMHEYQSTSHNPTNKTLD